MINKGCSESGTNSESDGRYRVGTDFEGRIEGSGDGLGVDWEGRIKYDQEFWQEKLNE